jgi:NADP-dependent 3-hydroxy acid dehydrogenase YdfG
MAESMSREAGPVAAPELEEVAGKAVVVTGGTTGIGRATALLLASKGANVLICGRHEPELNDAMEDLRATGGTVHGLVADTSSIDDIRRVFEEADRTLGGVDILINNAALAAEGAMDGDYTDWQYVVGTNLLGYIGCVQEGVRRMRARGGGHIVNIGSMSADVREPGSSVYVATKSGIQGFSEALRKEINKEGIKVTLIEPGLVGTDMTEEETPVEEQPKKQEEMKMLKAEDIAACVYYCLTQPKRCDVVSVQIRPHLQEI